MKTLTKQEAVDTTVVKVLRTFSAVTGYKIVVKNLQCTVKNKTITFNGNITPKLIRALRNKE